MVRGLRKKIELYLADGSLSIHIRVVYILPTARLIPKRVLSRSRLYLTIREASCARVCSRESAWRLTSEKAPCWCLTEHIRTPGIYRVAVVGKDNKVEIRPVKVSDSVDKFRCIR